MFVWTPDMIRFMQAANEKSDYHARLAAILTPKLSGCRTLWLRAGGVIRRAESVFRANYSSRRFR